MPADFEVGYKKPPKHTQFKPGQSGNAKGRPKGAKNLKTDLEEELSELIPIKEAGKSKKISKQRAMLKSLTAKAVRGDPRAASVVIGMVYRLLQDTPEQPEAEDLTAADKAILERFEAELLESLRTRDQG